MAWRSPHQSHLFKLIQDKFDLDGNSDVVKLVVLPTRRFPHIYGFNVKQSAKCFTVSAVDRHRRLPGSEVAATHGSIGFGVKIQMFPICPNEMTGTQ